MKTKGQQTAHLTLAGVEIIRKTGKPVYRHGDGLQYDFQEYSKEHVIRILMDRDDMDRESAEESVEETISELMDAAAEGDIFSGQDIVQDNLGLEPDYIEGLIGGA
jgi:hypothetical protein